jgi:hypothetical protein
MATMRRRDARMHIEPLMQPTDANAAGRRPRANPHMERIAMRLPLPVTLGLVLLGCTGDGHPAPRDRAAVEDSAFAGVQARGASAMGVNQYTSHHIFQPLPDGGRIELQRDVDDSVGIAQIRAHMHQIAAQFAAGDFRVPGFVHAREVPGMAVMAAKQAGISYSVESLPRGAAVRVRSADSGAVRAIHEFLAFQRQDHHAAAHHDS